MNRQEGRKLSGREATAEWIAKHAADFTDIGPGSAAPMAPRSERPSGRRGADQVGEVAREVTDRSADAARQGLEVVQRTAGAASAIEREVAHRSATNQTAALGRTLVHLTVAQTRERAGNSSKLTEAVDWNQVAKAVDWD